jgi:hypothetical protein
VSSLGWFARAGVHDGEHGAVAAAVTSFDDRVLVTAGGDGLVCVLAVRQEALLQEAAAAAASGREVVMEFKVRALGPALLPCRAVVLTPRRGVLQFPSALASPIKRAAPVDFVDGGCFTPRAALFPRLPFSCVVV